MTDPIRAQLAEVLDWEHAHLTFDQAVAGLAADARGRRPPGMPHSPWEIVEHIRIAQFDIYDFCVNPKYQHVLKWPEGYWPAAQAPSDEAAWTGSLAAIRRDRDAVKTLALDPSRDLSATIPWGKGQTYLREILLVAEHATYHLGELVAVRRALGAWPT